MFSVLHHTFLAKNVLQVLLFSNDKLRRFALAGHGEVYWEINSIPDTGLVYKETHFVPKSVRWWSLAFSLYPKIDSHFFAKFNGCFAPPEPTSN